VYTYHYKARDKSGGSVRGTIEAESEKAAKRLLSDQKLIPIQINTSQAQGFLDVVVGSIRRFRNRVPDRELLVFIQQLQTVYTVGIPILDGLNLIWDQTEHPVLKRAIKQIIDDVSDGRPLHLAFARHPDIFDEVYVNLIKVGEASGNLDELLDRIYTLSEARVENKAKVKSALFYPKIVIGFMIIVFYRNSYFCHS